MPGPVIYQLIFENVHNKRRRVEYVHSVCGSEDNPIVRGMTKFDHYLMFLGEASGNWFFSGVREIPVTERDRERLESYINGGKK
jgi:hypothetical protein